MTALPEHVLFAVDVSGSTSSEHEYWVRVDSLYQAYLHEHGSDKLKPIMWHSSVEECTHEQLVANINHRRGRGGTAPAEFARMMAASHGVDYLVTKLCLITDGEIDISSVNRCDVVMKALADRCRDSNGLTPMPEVEACIFGRYKVNLTVVAPFARGAQFAIRHNDMALAAGDASVAIEASDRLDRITTPAEFFDAFESLRQVIVVQNLGKTNETLRDQLLVMQRRLLAWIAHDNKRRALEAAAAAAAGGGEDGGASQSEEEAITHPVLRPLVEGNYDAALESLRTMIYQVEHPDEDEDEDEATMDPAKRVGLLVQTLVEACMLGSYQIESLTSRRAGRANVQQTPEVVVPQADDDDNDAMDTEESVQTRIARGMYECPLLFDAAAPVLLIADPDRSQYPEGILSGATKDQIDDVTNNPLNVLRHPDLVQRIAACLDHVIGAEAFTQIYTTSGRWALRSPYSRSPLIGCLPLGTHPQHVTLGNWVVRRLVSNAKVMGDSQLWVAALYMIVMRHVPRLRDGQPAMMAAFRAHLQYRLFDQETNLALSGMPEAGPLVKVPMAVALWYCVSASTALYASDPAQFRRERLRDLYPIGMEMRELVVDVCGLPVVSSTANDGDAMMDGEGEDDPVLDRIAILEAFAVLMARKTDPALQRELTMLVQNSAEVPALRIDWTSPTGLSPILPGTDLAALNTAAAAITKEKKRKHISTLAQQLAAMTIEERAARQVADVAAVAEKQIRGRRARAIMGKKRGKRARTDAIAAATTAAPLSVSVVPLATCTVLTDGPADAVAASRSPLAPIRDRISLGRLFYLKSRADPRRAARDVRLFPADVAHARTHPEEHVPAPISCYGYRHATEAEAVGLVPVSVCPGTLRPWHAIDAEPWQVCAERVHGAPVDTLLSTYKLFADYVQQFGRYPATLADYVQYMADRQAGRVVPAPAETLPSDIVDMARRVVAAYAVTFGGLVPTPEQFVMVTRAGYSNSVREAMEACGSWVEALAQVAGVAQ